MSDDASEVPFWASTERHDRTTISGSSRRAPHWHLGGLACGHRTYGRQLRNAQLELHNIGPYLAELDPDARAAVRTQLVPTFFGKALPSVQEDDSPTTAASADQLIEFARLLVTKQ